MMNRLKVLCLFFRGLIRLVAHFWKVLSSATGIKDLAGLADKVYLTDLTLIYDLLDPGYYGRPPSLQTHETLEFPVSSMT